jgi:CRP/FNR family transcriptional regulator, anaerobic regulatory protein
MEKQSDSLIKELSKYIAVSDELQYDLSHSFTSKDIKKGSLLLESGTVCDKIYFINKGLVRGMLYHENTEVTSWFARENEFAFSTNSFFDRFPSYESIEVLEDGDFSVLHYQKSAELFKRFPELVELRRHFFERYYLNLKKRMVTLQSMQAQERYQQLISSDPDLLLRVPLKYISSYLGITQETLSRIRKQKI